MAGSVELATAYVSVAAETSALSKNIAAAFNDSNKTALKAGKTMGRAVAKGYNSTPGPDFDQLRRDAEKADAQVAASAERGAKARADAARKVEIAELKVQETRARSIKQNSDVKAAEKALAAARADGAAEDVARAESALAAARESAAPTSADLAAEDRLVKARDAERLAAQKAEAELIGYRDAQDRANAALRDAEQAAQGAGSATDKAARAFGGLGDRVKSAFKGDFKGAFKSVERESKAASSAVADNFAGAGDSGGAGMLDALKGTLLGAAGALGIGASFGELFQQGVMSTMSTARLRASLGLSDSEAAQLGKDAAEAYRAGFGEDRAAATSVTGAVRQFLGPNVDVAQMTKYALAMEQAFGTDPQENIKAVSQLIRTGMVPSAEAGFDILTRGYQSGADKAGDLTDTMTEYGTQFRNLGIDGATAMGVLSQGLNAGARDADKVADAFKEFSIRAVDGSALTAQSFAALGMDADTMAQRIAAGGSVARDATQDVLAGLGAVEDPAQRAQIAVGLFGTQAEDLGGALFALNLDTAASGMGTVAGASQSVADTMAAAQSPIERLQRAFSDIGSSLGAQFVGPMNTAVDAIIRVGEFMKANPAVFATITAGLTAMAISAGVLAGAFTGLATAAATAWGAITAPVTLVIGAITLVTAGLVLFFTKTEIGRKIWAAAWGAIKNAALVVWNWISGTLWPGIVAAWNAIGAAAMWMWTNAIQPAWNAIAAAAQWLYNTIILPVWTAIRIAIAVVVTAIVSYVQLVQWWWRNVLGPIMIWLYRNVVLPVWNGIKSAIGGVVAWFRDTAWSIVSRVIGWLSNEFSKFKFAMQIIWAYIRDVVIGPFIAWFRDTVWPVISSVLGNIQRGFNIMRDAIRAAWAYVRDTAIAPVVNWLNKYVKPTVDRFTANVKRGFDVLKNGVLAAWNAIRDGMKKPINGVIGIYNKHLRGNFNKVADTLKLDKKYRLPAMAEFARGGWTGPGAKYQEAGIVHADEFVIRKESQRSLAAAAPGFLDALNRYGARALGYAGGGLVKLAMPFRGSYPRGDGFGARGGAHKGIDWPIPAGTPLYATNAGTAIRTSNAKAGNKLELLIGNGLTVGYHHLSRFGKTGAVAAGDIIGYVGSTGRSSGPHLHFSVKKDGTYVDPARYLGAGGAAGNSGGGFWNPFAGLWESIKSAASAAVGDSMVGQMALSAAQNITSGISSWVTDKITSFGEAVSNVVETGTGYARYAPIATLALQMTGHSLLNLPSLMARMRKESGFNPRAVNNWDVNARNGTPSKGLMQVISPTFRAYAEPGYDKDIFDPLSNILASINYTAARYGSLRAGWNRAGGYATGGLVTARVYDRGGWLMPGDIAVNQSTRPEPVFSGAQWEAMQRNGIPDSNSGRSGNTYNITVPADPSEDRTTVARRISEVLDFRELERAVRA